MERDSLSAALAAELQTLEGEALRRHLRPAADRIGGDPGAAADRNFASNDYLGLAVEPFMLEAAKEALGRFGTGSGASRLICGNHPPHIALEEALAHWKRTEAALCFSSGYATALGVIPALVGTGDVVILDKLCHACIIDGARLSGASLRVFPHNNLERLKSLLEGTRKRHPSARILVATESVFSMDGDLAPLAEIVALKERYGAWLLVDEAHAVGVLGETGGGLQEALGLGNRVDIQMGTLSKALGGAGGYVCGSRVLVDWLVNKARSLVFSTAPPPVNAAVALAAVQWMPTEEGQKRRSRLFENVACFARCMPAIPPPLSAIVPLPAGSSEAALRWSGALADAGFWVPAIRYPTVPRGQARLRVTLSALHSHAGITELTAALKRCA